LLGCGSNREPGVWRENVNDLKDSGTQPAKTSALTRISTLTGQLSEALNYVTAPSTGSYWTEAQKRRAWQSIERKKGECRRLIASLATPFKKRLHDVTEAAWNAAEEEHHNRPDPEAPLLERQRKLIAVIRQEAALQAQRPRKLKALGTKLKTIAADLDYARRARYDYWTASQKRRSAFSIRKKQTAAIEVIAGLDMPELREERASRHRAGAPQPGG
jgi:hypothetical protein